jgi:tetratricopeptide (TPR) repeat protein
MQEPAAQITKLIDQGRYFEAQATAHQLLAISPSGHIKQLYALALSKSGSPEAALQFMEPVYLQSPDDVEAAGIMGSICKELFKKNQSTAYAIRSRDTYLSNFNFTKNFYTGINAASMSAMAGQAGKSREIATEVISLLDKNSADFWVQASLGEAYLLIKDKLTAADFFVKARKLVGNDWGKVTSVHNQLWLLNHFLQVPTDILKLFNPPGIVAFIGHMIDQPQRSEPRFPAAIELKIKEAIIHSLRSINARIGYSSLACGGDILFAEAMAELGGEVTIFLPFDKDDFIATSVRFAGEHWVDRVERFPVHYITKEHYQGFDELFSFQSKIIFGSALLHSHYAHAEPSLVMVLSDIDLKRKEGGTRATVNMWPHPTRIFNINPDAFVAPQAVAPRLANYPTRTGEESTHRLILYLAHIEFQEGELSVEKMEEKFELLKSQQSQSFLTIANTHALVAFEAESALLEFIKQIKESKNSYATKPNLKIALHAGPVYEAQQGLGGNAIELVKELSIACLIGSIAVSDSFARLLAVDGNLNLLTYGGLFVDSTGQQITVYNLSLDL